MSKKKKMETPVQTSPPKSSSPRGEGEANEVSGGEVLANTPASTIGQMNGILRGFNFSAGAFGKLRDLAEVKPLDQRGALELHYSREPERTEEIKNRIGMGQKFQLFLLKPHRREPNSEQFAFTVTCHGATEPRIFVLRTDEPTLVDAADAFTLLTQHEGLIGEWAGETAATAE